MSALMILGMNRERYVEASGPNQHWRKTVHAGSDNHLTARRSTPARSATHQLTFCDPANELAKHLREPAKTPAWRSA
jgi:hypothetical protein